MVSHSETRGKRKGSGSSQPPPTPFPRRLGKYKIKKSLGSGGMGTVFLAVDTQLRRTVALKVLPREKAANPTLVRRFHSEAQAAAQLKHENIVTVYEAGELDGYLYMALEYVEGTDVHKLVSTRGVIPVKRSVDIVKQVTRALKHAHERNVVHRDIKPSNLLIQRDGTVKLGDMGLARLVDETEETSITRAGTTVGTVDYIAPEQARDSKAADICSDIYSLGCAWYHMLTAEPPFPGGSMTNKLYGHMAKERPDPREKNDAVPASVVKVMHRMMARKKKNRYQSPAELLRDLENLDTSPDDSPRGFSEKLYAAIADDDDEVQSTETEPTEGQTRSVSSKAAASGGRPRPAGRSAKRRGAGAPPSRGSRAPVWTYVAVGVVVCLFVGVLWWIAAGLASALDSPGAVIARSGAHEDAKDPDSRDEPSVNNGASEGDSSDGRQTTNGRPSETPTGRAGSANDNTVFVGSSDPDDAAAISIGREGEKKYLPAWVAETADIGAPLPTNLPVLTVGRGEAPPQFADLKGALPQIPKSGAVIELQGDGPFEFPPALLDGEGTVIITGQAESRPILLFEPDPDQPTKPVLRVRNGRLALLNVHLAAAARRFATEAPITLIDVAGAELAVRGCSATLFGTRPGETVFIRLSDRASDREHAETRLLLDRSFVRGRWAPVELDCRDCDLLAWNSLFVTGEAPLLRAVGRPTRPTADKKTSALRGDKADKHQRLIRLLSCTASARRTAFEFTADDTPPLTTVLLLNSLLGARAGQSGDSDLVLIGQWPHSKTPIAQASQFHELNWSVRNSVLLGWSNLVRQDKADDPILARGQAQWQRVWQSAPVESEFARLLWPGSSTPTAEPDFQLPDAFDRATTDVKGVATDGELPGCQIAALALPSPDLMRRARALAHRPVRPPAVISNPDSAHVVHVDLNSEDLGRVISSSDWPDGTLFVATGAGPQTSSPIRVRGQSLRIEFRQAEGLELQLSARPINRQLVAKNGEFWDSFLSIRDGTIEISGGNFKIPRSTTRPYPRWFLYAEDASFVLENCSATGALLAASRNRHLIRWTTTGKAAPAGRYSGQYSHHGHIRNSFLAAYGTMFRIDAAQQALHVENSVLAGVHDLFELDIGGDDPDIRGAVALDRCTLSAGHRFFDVRSKRRRERPGEPLRLFVNQTVFAPPLERTPDGGPTLLAVSDDAAVSQHQVQWWGYANAYTHLMGNYVSGTSVSGKSFAKSWLQSWTAAACLFPIAQSGDVALKRKYPPLSRLAAGDFQLDPASKAARWDDLGNSIGPDLLTIAAHNSQPARSERPKRAGDDKPKTPRF